jgi:flagellar hook-basal body complex protein FliE
MTTPGVLPVGAVGGVGDVGALGELYRNQILGDQAGIATLPGSSSASPSAAARGADFAGALGRSVTDLEGLDRTASTKAVQAATGDLGDIQDYVIAATQAQLAAQLTTTVRNKAVDAFNEIMRMPL